MKAQIAVIGMGRMGRGIALSYIYAGLPVLLVDAKARKDSERIALIESTLDELNYDLELLQKSGLIDKEEISRILERLSFSSFGNDTISIDDYQYIFEAVPEILEAKKNVFRLICEYANDDAIIASTTSTFSVNELAVFVTHAGRFVNAHWLNPAHLIPLVEVSKGDSTSPQTVKLLIGSLESIGKIPVVCTASPGYIVPRIQAAAMNEAARLVEEGVASAEDVDKAVNVGFGIRFAVLGLLEFIDWGGADTLLYASNYLSEKISPRFTAPEILKQNISENRRGIADGRGFLTYSDTAAHREERIFDFIEILNARGLLPKVSSANQKK